MLAPIENNFVPLPHQILLEKVMAGQFLRFLKADEVGMGKTIETGMQQNLSGDLLTIDIRRALHYLGAITGQVEIDRDILGTKFCIGK